MQRGTQRSLSTFQAQLQGYRYRRAYRGPLKGAILDWSGTCADNWVIAPAAAFVEAFREFKVIISMEEARGPMGLRKDLHIKALTQVPEIATRWKAVHGREPNDSDVKAMFEKFVPAQLRCLPKYTGLIPGTAEAVNILKAEYGLKIGNTTGFQRVMVDVLLADAKKQGYVPDCSVAGDEVRYPRPYPMMVFRNMDLLDLQDVKSVVKVDDTVSGVEEGLNAGCWAVGLSHTSNYMNINTYEERAKMSNEEFESRGKKSREKLLKSGAHYVIDDITFLPQVVDDINQRLARGENP
jgi:phosphonoacetaldehyde hydrolase